MCSYIICVVSMLGKLRRYGRGVPSCFSTRARTKVADKDFIVINGDRSGMKCNLLYTNPSRTKGSHESTIFAVGRGSRGERLAKTQAIGCRQVRIYLTGPGGL